MPKYVYCPQCCKELVSQERGGRERSLCPDSACGFVHWDNPLPVVAALVEFEGNIILVRNVGWPETWFGLVTGFLERDETPEAGVLRELQEELSLNGEIVSRIGVYAFPMRNELIVAYHVRATGSIHLGEELEAYKAIPPEKLKAWPMGTGEAVRDWLASRQ